MTKHEAKQEKYQLAIPMLSDVGSLSNIFAKSAAAYQQAFMDWQKEIATFVADRLEQDMESLQSLAEERTFPAFLKIQQDWFSTAIRDYSQEGRKLAELAGRLATAGLTSEKQPETRATL